MRHQKKENAAPTAMGNGAKLTIEDTKIPIPPTTKKGFGAIYFWNQASQSVEPLRVHHGGVIV